MKKLFLITALMLIFGLLTAQKWNPVSRENRVRETSLVGESLLYGSREVRLPIGGEREILTEAIEDNLSDVDDNDVFNPYLDRSRGILFTHAGTPTWNGGNAATNPNGYFMPLHRYTSEQLAGFGVVGRNLTHVGFLTGTFVPNAEIWVVVWYGPNYEDFVPGPANANIRQSAGVTGSFTPLTWYEIELNNPFLIQEGYEMLIGMQAIHRGTDVAEFRPYRGDAGPAVLDCGNILGANAAFNISANSRNWNVYGVADFVGPRPLPFTQNFESIPLYTSGQYALNVLSWTGLLDDDYSGITPKGDALGGGRVLSVDLYGISHQWGITPLMGPITATTVIDFDYLIRSYSNLSENMLPGDRLGVLVSTTDTQASSFTSVYEVNSTNHTTTIQYTPLSIPLGAYAGNNVYIKFDMFSSGDRDFRIDNIEIKNIGSSSGLALPYLQDFENGYGNGSEALASIGWTGLVDQDWTYIEAWMTGDDLSLIVNMWSNTPQYQYVITPQLGPVTSGEVNISFDYDWWDYYGGAYVPGTGDWMLVSVSTTDTQDGSFFPVYEINQSTHVPSPTDGWIPINVTHTVPEGSNIYVRFNFHWGGEPASNDFELVIDNVLITDGEGGGGLIALPYAPQFGTTALWGMNALNTIGWTGEWDQYESYIRSWLPSDANFALVAGLSTYTDETIPQYAITPKLGPVESGVLKIDFDYDVEEYGMGGQYQFPTANDRVVVLISTTDTNNASFTPIHTINSSNHVVGAETSWKHRSITTNVPAGSEVYIKYEFWYGEVTGDYWVALNNVVVEEVYVEPLPENAIQIGEGEMMYDLPLDTRNTYSYSQTIFLASELTEIDGNISKLSYYWDPRTAGGSVKNWEIFIGHTAVSVFPDLILFNAVFNDVSFITHSTLTPVYSGQISLPAQAGWIDIELDTAFLYNNIDNLVVAVNVIGTVGENHPGDDTRGVFHGSETPGQRRSRSVRRNTEPYDAPPTSGIAINHGHVQTNGRANIRFHYEEPLPTIDIVIGTGNLNTAAAPIATNWGYSYIQTIYHQEEIGTSGLIHSISYFYNGNTGFVNKNQWEIYMGHTTMQSFPETNTLNSFVPINNLTPVFSGIVPMSTATGWFTIVLETPFMYNNIQNLVIAVNEVTPSNVTSPNGTFVSTVPAVSNRTFGLRRDGNVPYDVNNLADATMFRIGNVPNLTIAIEPMEIPPPDPIVVIGDGTVINVGTAYQNYLPSALYHYNSYMQQIYLQSELDREGKIIEKIAFHYNGVVFTNIDTHRDWEIYIGHTSKTAFANTTDWVPFSDMSLVFEGFIPEYPTTADWMEIVLDVPFAYNNVDNLVIAVYKKRQSVTAWSSSAGFYMTATPGENRGIGWSQDAIPAFHPPTSPPTAGALTAGFPNITVTFGDAGMIAGLVTSGDAPLAGATISITGTSQSVLSDENGLYSILLPTGIYDLTASMVGYEDWQTTGVVVNANATTTQNIEMIASISVTVSGRVLASDTNQPHAQALVLLSGYGEIPMATTDAEGYFTINNVFGNQTYTLTIGAVGYLPYINNAFVVGASNITIPDVILEEQTYPPRNVTARSLTSSVAYIAWDAPNIPDPNNPWFSHSTASTVGGGLGGTAAHTIEMGHRYTPSQLLSMGVLGQTLSQISFNVSTFSGADPATVLNSVQVRAYTGGSGSPFNPGEMIYSQNVPLSDITMVFVSNSDVQIWNDIVLTEPITIPTTGEFWITVFMDVQVGYAAAASPQGSWTNNFGNLYAYNGGAWQTSAAVGTPAWQRDFLLRGQATTSSGRSITINPISYTMDEMLGTDYFVENRQYNDRDEAMAQVAIGKDAVVNLSFDSLDFNASRVFESYNIYRTLEANINNESMWTAIATNHTNREYYDNSWVSALDRTNYIYVVRSVYTDNNVSVAVPSNVINKMPGEPVYVGDPNSTTGSTEFPFQYYYHTGLSQSIYLPGEINQSGTITDITFEFSGTGVLPNDIIHRVWMANIDKTVFTGTLDWVPFEHFTLVYEGTLPVNVAGLNDINITLDTAYEYDGNNSLIIMTQRNNPPAQWWSNQLWRISPAGGNRTIWIRADAANHNPANPGTGTLNTNIPNTTIYFAPEDPTKLVEIGTGTTLVTPPVEQYYNNSYSQTIYYASEIGISNMITRIYYHWNGVNAGLNWRNWEVYMGHTDRTDFPSTAVANWIPTTDLSLVYAGMVTETAGAGWIEIVLTTPFEYDNAHNLVIAVHKQGAWLSTGSAGMFFGTPTPGTNRAMIARSDTNPSPYIAGILNNNLPVAWTVPASHPNIRIQLEPIMAPTFELTPLAKDFGSVAMYGASYQDFVVKNRGWESLIISNLEIIGESADEFVIRNHSELTTPLIVNYLEEITITVGFKPQTEGIKMATLIITELETGRTINAIPLYGESSDGTITSLPYSENFDASQELPFGWGSIVNAMNITPAIPAVVDIVSSEPNSPPNVMRLLANGGDNNGIVMAYSPLIENIDTTYLSFFARTNANVDDVKIIVGSLSDIDDHNSFVEHDSFFLTNTYQKYFVSLEGTDASRFAFKHGLGGSANIPIFIDDVELHIKSTEPTLSVSHEVFHFGEVPVFTDSASQTITIVNTGADGLYLSEIMIIDPYEGYLIYDTEMNLENITLAFMETVEIEFKFHPEHAGELSANIIYFGENGAMLGMTTLIVSSIDAILTITPNTPQDFGTVTIPAVSAPRNFSISNTGIGTLTINSIEIWGEDNTHFSIILPFANRSNGRSNMAEIDLTKRIESVNEGVERGANRRNADGFPISLENTSDPFNFSVQFTPHSGGVKSGVLTIIYDDVKTFTLDLSGTAIDNSVSEFPFIEQFTPTTPWPPAGGWTRHSGQLPATGNAVLGANNTGNWFSSFAYANTSGHPNGDAAYIEVWNQQHGWLISPEINLDATAGEKVLNFDVALTNYNDNGTPALSQRNARFVVLVSDNNQWSTQNILAEWAENAAVGAERYYNRIPNYGESISLDLSDYSGIIRIAFFAVPLTGSDNFLHLDNVVVREKEEITISEYPWVEGFEGALFPPRGWTSFTNNPLGFNWNRGFIANTGGFNAASESFRNGFDAVTPDNWLITPKLSLPDIPNYLINLSYFVAGLDPSYNQEHYSVLISTTDTAQSSFTAIHTETLNSATYALKTINLDAYAGQDIYLAFRHHLSPDWFMLRIDDVSINIAPYIPPPQNLIAMPKFGMVDLEWGAPADAVPYGYRVYRGGMPITDVITEMSYRDRDLLHTVEVTYYVTAMFAEGESVPSNTVTVTPVGENLIPPVNFAANLVGTTATLTWEAPETGWFTHTQDDSTVGGVGLGETAAADLLAAQRFTAAQLTAMGVAGKELTRLAIMVGQANATYTLMVWSGGSLVGTTFSPGNVIHQQPIGTNLAINTWLNYELTTPVLIPSNQELWIGYRAVTSGGYPLVRDNGPEITNFGALIQWATNPWNNLGAVGIPGYNWCIKGFAETATGTVAIERSNNHIEIEPPVYNRESSHITMVESSPQTSFGRNREIFERSVTGFNVYRNNVLMTPTPITATTYTNTNLVVDAYLYEVTSVYAAGESDPVSALLKLGLNAPTGLTAVPGSGKADLSWVAPVSPGISINGYRIYRNGEPVSDIVTGTVFTATGLTNGVTYSFDVRAVYATTIPNHESGASNVITVTPVGEALLQPRNLSFTQNYSEISLNWDVPGINEGWFNHNDEVYVGGLGGTATTTFMAIAHRYTPAMLLELGVVGGVISQVGFRTNDPAAIWTVVIWTGGTISPINPGTEIYRQTLGSNSVGGWRDYTLNNPVPITSAAELWIGFEITHAGGTHPVCRDGGPGLIGFGDIITISGYPWGTIGQYYNISTPNGSANTFIRAFATTPSGRAITIGAIDPELYTIDLPELTMNGNGRNSAAIGQHEDVTTDRGGERAFEYYNVYLNGNLVGSSTSQNYVVEVLNAGPNTFGVSAVYSDGGESLPVTLSQTITNIERLVETFPYVEGFETAILSGWRNRNQAWSRVVSAQQAFSGIGFMQSESVGANTDHWLISPKFALLDPPEQQNFVLNYHVSSSTSQNYSILISTTGVAEEDFEILETRNINSTTWTQRQISLSDYLGESINIAIRHHGNTGAGNLRIDNFRIETDYVAPLFVITPTEGEFGLVGIGLTATQSFSISNPSPVDLVIAGIEITGEDADYFAIVDPTSIVFPYIVSLNPPTTLDFDIAFTPLTLGIKNATMVITDELGEDYLVQLNGQSMDDSVVVPFVENFSLPTPVHWTRFTGMVGGSLTPFTGNWGAGSNWHLGNFANNANHQNGQSARVNLFGQMNNWLVTPTIVMDLAEVTDPDFFYLAFDMALTSRTGSAQPNGFDDRFIVLISENNGVSWTQIDVWDNQGSNRVLNNVSGTGERMNVNLSGYDFTNVVPPATTVNFKLAFYAESTVFNADNIIHVDNVMINTTLGVTPITNLVVTDVDEEYVRLAWDAPVLHLEGIQPYYQVFRNGVEIAEVTALYYEDVLAPSDASHIYSIIVTYRNPEINSAEVSLSQPVFVPRFTPVTNLAAQVSDSENVVLTWTAPAAQNVGEPLGYRIYRDGELLNTTLIAVNTLTYTDYGLTLDIEYNYAVTVVYDFFGGVDRESVPATLDIIVPQFNPVTDLYAQIGDAIVELSWFAPVPQNYGTITGYRIYRNGIVRTVTQDLVFTDTSVVNGTTYTYHIVVIWGGEISGDSISSSSLTLTPSAESVPQGLTLTIIDETSVLLQWSPVTIPGRGNDVANRQRNTGFRGYNVYRDGVQIATEIEETQYLDDGLTLDIILTYEVVAVFDDFIISFPAVETIVVPVYTPITNLSLALVDVNVVLTWTSPAPQNYGTLQGIEIIRGTQHLPMLPPTATTYTDNNVAIDAIYEYHVIAHYVGEITGQSEAVSGSILVPVYYPPRNLVSENGLDAIVPLSWEEPFTQNYGLVSGYRVYSRLADTGQTFVAISGDIPATQLNYTATGLNNAVNYEFNVIALYSFADYPELNGVSLPSNTVVGRPEDNILMPRNLTYSFEGIQVLLSWEEPSEATRSNQINRGRETEGGGRAFLGYHVYRNNIRLTVTPTPALTFMDMNTQLDMLYVYGVTALYDSGESDPVEISVLVQYYAPATNVVATHTVGSGYVTLTWVSPPDLDLSPVHQFFIRRNGVTAPIGNVMPGTTTFTDHNITEDTQYIYTVQVVYVFEGGGHYSEEAASNAVVVPKFTPLSVLNLDFNEHGEVVLSWTVPAAQTFGTVRGYKVTRNNVVMGIVLAPNLTFTDNIQIDMYYEYSVAVQYNDLNGQLWGESSEISTNVLLPKANPIRNLTAQYVTETGLVELNWVSPEAQNLGTISHILIRRNDDPTPLTALAEGETNFIDGTVETDSEYYYTVQVIYNFAGIIEDQASEIVTSNTVIVPRFSPISDLTGIVNSEGRVVLTWTSPANTVFGQIESFRISRNGTVIGATNAGITIFTDGLLPNDEIYEYGIVTIYTNPFGISTEVKTEVHVPRFNPPTKLEGVAGDVTITINWTAPETQKHGVLLGYRVFKNTIAMENIIPFNITTLTDTDVENYLDYLYHVVALYANPEGVSIPTNEITLQPRENMLPPTDLSHQVVGGNNVVLNWTAPENIFRGFRILRNSQDISGIIEETMYVDSGLNDGEYFYEVKTVYWGGDSTAATTSVIIRVPDDDWTELPVVNELVSNYPNPFNPDTTIRYNVAQAGNVVIDIYNVRGQKIATLLNSHKEAGEHTVVWHGLDGSGREVSSGIYLAIMRMDNFTQIKRMTLLK